MAASRPDRASLAGLVPAIPIILLAVVLQATIVARIRFFGAAPNLLLVLVICWSLLRGFAEGIRWSFIGGIALDLIAGLPLGATALALMSICLLGGLGESELFQGNIFLPVIATAAASPIYAAALLLVRQALGLSVGWQLTFAQVVLPETMINVLTAALVFPLLRWLAQRMGLPRMEW